MVKSNDSQVSIITVGSSRWWNSVSVLLIVVAAVLPAVHSTHAAPVVPESEADTSVNDGHIRASKVRTGSRHRQTQDDIAIHMANSSKIINGATVAFGEYPSFAYPETPYCGGTLIWEDVIVTAAHCKGGFKKGIDMYIGGTKQDGSNARDTIPIDFPLSHPDYDGFSTTGYDIMLLFLKSSSKAPISPWNRKPKVPVERQIVTVIGHGATETGFSSPDLLQVDLNVVDTTKCANLNRDFYDPVEFVQHFICTSARPRSACYGDSGGPLFTRNGLLVGLVSGGSFDCVRPERPNRYTRLSTYSDWIQRNICHYSANPPSDGTCDEYTSPCEDKHTTNCTFLGLLPGVTMHKYDESETSSEGPPGDDFFGSFDDFFSGTCVDQCYPLSTQRLMRRGSTCGPCPTYNFTDDFIFGSENRTAFPTGTETEAPMDPTETRVPMDPTETKVPMDTNTTTTIDDDDARPSFDDDFRPSFDDDFKPSFDDDFRPSRDDDFMPSTGNTTSPTDDDK